MREKDPVAERWALETRLLDPATHGPGANEHRVVIERAGLDGMDGQRVHGIVLEYAEHTARHQDPSQLREDRHMSLVRYVVEHAAGEGEIDTTVRERQRRPIEGDEIRAIITALMAQHE